VCSLFRVKSILGVGPKVNDSIEDPFKYETWLGSVHDELCVKVKSMTTVSEVCEYECLVTSFVFSIMDILGLAVLEWFFSSQSFHFVNNYHIFSFLFSAFKIFLLYTNTHLVI
jgi:hypothetical protein